MFYLCGWNGSAIAEYLSLDLPYKLSPDDIFLTGGCTQAIEVIISVLARPGANILLPRPGYPFYESRCAFSGLEVRHFNLVLERSWEVDLDSVEALADENTVVMVVINPGNPGGNVFTNQHLAKVSESQSMLDLFCFFLVSLRLLNFSNHNLVKLHSLGCRNCK